MNIKLVGVIFLSTVLSIGVILYDNNQAKANAVGTSIIVSTVGRAGWHLGKEMLKQAKKSTYHKREKKAFNGERKKKGKKVKVSMPKGIQ